VGAGGEPREHRSRAPPARPHPPPAATRRPTARQRVYVGGAARGRFEVLIGGRATAAAPGYECASQWPPTGGGGERGVARSWRGGRGGAPMPMRVGNASANGKGEQWWRARAHAGPTPRSLLATREDRTASGREARSLGGRSDSVQPGKPVAGGVACALHGRETRSAHTTHAPPPPPAAPLKQRRPPTYWPTAWLGAVRSAAAAAAVAIAGAKIIGNARMHGRTGRHVSETPCGGGGGGGAHPAAYSCPTASPTVQGEQCSCSPSTQTAST